jgi:YegS/Rv2252/BmrU family lipid kinase
VPRRILVIVNPAAGKPRRAARRLRRAVAELERRGCALVIRLTAGPGDAERLAREAEPGFDLIVAAGGDGTVGEIANGLAGSSLPLALLPLGTANVLAHEIGLPRRPERVAALIAEAQPRPIWPGRIGDRLFVAMAGVGFDAEVIAQVGVGLKRRFGKLAFAVAAVECLWRRRPSEIVVRAGGSTFRAASVIITKGRFYAGRFRIAPGVRAADPLLQLALLRRGDRVAVLRALVALPCGYLHRLRDVSVLHAGEALLDSPEPSPIEADGEIIGRLPAAVRIADRPLLLVQPAAAGIRARRRAPPRTPVGSRAGPPA